MKMSKFRLVFLVLLVATVIYVVAFALSEWRYYSRLAEMMMEFEAKGGFVTLKPFLATSEGHKLFIGEIVLCVVWIILLNLRVWKGNMNENV